MSSWNELTNDDEDIHGNPPISSLLPSSLRDIWEDETDQFQNQRFLFPDNDDIYRKQAYSLPRPIHSFPYDSFQNLNQADVQFQGEIETDEKSANCQYYYVKFHPNRRACFYTNQKQHFKPGDYVLTEADRGFDIGMVVDTVKKPSPREQRSAKMIVRIAHQHEIDQLPQKAEREAKALALCQAKAAELALPMKITGAEFQFDGKKLTFYYTAQSYIDFRILVRTLFKVFGTRIWMCCTSEMP
ncbi:PSP1 C-terminal conserved region family protein [Histomonas meleagridis]|uniref:PSP1 C-terminal conserved region family protein n=1 Tax=Histomonas meleagridis TaxID=135588 RepID=UPI00355ABB3E|nr:PSP1 C-terminal conserved region family protein [Histomonas meleagridis]KAH0803393.1 PSP1 C-terminal conserved region family protein [Histomonas meleagridis]